MNMTKIHITITAMLAMLLSSAHAQTTSQNYVKTVTMLDAAGTKSLKSVQYYNGRGYPTVAVSTVGTDGQTEQTVATLTTYDALGREDCKYVPVPRTGLSYITESSFFNNGKKYYQDNGIFTQNYYDALDRVTAVDIAGDKWRRAGKQNRTEYLANTDEDKVKHYVANPNGKNSLMREDDANNKFRFYPAGSLTKEVSIDADNKKVITFKDFFGNVILQRANDGTNNLDTYYVYNEIGQLRYVLTPQCQKTGISAIKYYEYCYDARGRDTLKIQPGCKAIRYWYDNADRIAYMKDPALGSRYRFYLYDKLGRLCVQGTCTGGNQAETILSTTSYVSGTNNGICKTGYTAPYTINNPKLEIVNYYDNYDFKDKQQKAKMPTVTVDDNQKQYAIGSLTGTVVYATNGEALGTINVYDQKGQLVKSVRKGLGGFVEDVKNAYTFTGDVDNTEATVNVKYGYGNFSAKTQYTYDDYGKKTKMTLSVRHGSNTQTRQTEYSYDLIGRLQGKKRYLYGTNKYSSCSYTYDVHSWLTSISSGGFQEYLYYADTGGIDDTKYYNGNISAYKWKNRNDNDYMGYILKYDGNNRLREAAYGCGNNLSSNKNYFSEYVDEYDYNGNIKRLKRRGLTDKSHGGFGYVDDLYMTYSGNKLTRVRDNATHDAYNGATDFYTTSKDKEYPLTYNNSGSLVSDAGRKIARIKYDVNNNPVRIQFTNGNVTNYVYSVTGEKLRVIYQTSIYPEDAEIVEIGKTKELSQEEIKCTETVDYLLGGALTLRNGVIDKYQFEEGYCQATPMYDNNKMPIAESFTFCYYDQDHLGNIRQVTEDDGSSKGKVIQTMNYYPFGAEFCDNSTKSYVQNHKYNGKEFDNMHGLNTYDYGARQYNPVTARWDRIDPLSEKYYSTSPYAYCRNNPIMRIDVDGLYDVDTLNNYSPVVAIFPINYKEDVDYVENPKTGVISVVPGALQYDHWAAVDAGVNVITVINASDALAALTYLNDMGIQYNTVTINSHGSANCFYIGEERVTKKNADKVGETLAPVLKGKDVFIGACNVGKNMEMLQSFSVLSESTTIGAQQQVNCAYHYDGSNKLNMPFPWRYKDDYSVATPIGGCTNVKNVTINKYQGISWNNKGW